MSHISITIICTIAHFMMLLTVHLCELEKQQILAPATTLVSFSVIMTLYISYYVCMYMYIYLLFEIFLFVIQVLNHFLKTWNIIT